jgi:sugar lactone lactonase YvrE
MSRLISLALHVRPRTWQSGAGALLIVLLLFGAWLSRAGGTAVRPATGEALSGWLTYIGGGDVWVQQAGGTALQLTHDGAAIRVRWTPGGSALMVEERNRVVTLSRDGTPLAVSPGAWLPDDSAVAVRAADGGIDLVGADGTQLGRLLAGGPNLTLEPAAWSPDGATLAVNRVQTDGRGIPSAQAVWLVNRDGSQTHELLPPTTNWPQALGWSPDGRWLAVFRGPAMACVSCRVDGQELDAVERATGRTVGAGTVVRPDGFCFTGDGAALIASVGAGRESYRDKQVVRVDLADGSVSHLAGGADTAAIQPACAAQGSGVAFIVGPALAGEPFSGLDSAHGYPQALLAGRRLRDGSAIGGPATPPAGSAQEAPRWAGAGTVLFVQWAVGADGLPARAQLWSEAVASGEQALIVPSLGTSVPPAPYFGDDGLADLFDWHP